MSIASGDAIAPASSLQTRTSGGLFDLQGQQVLRHQVQADSPIDISALNAGLFIYLLEVGGKTVRGKVVVR